MSVRSTGDNFEFERAKATAHYNWLEVLKFKIYAIVRPHLNPFQRRDLDLYQRHVVLTDGIDKVKKAFKPFDKKHSEGPRLITESQLQSLISSAKEFVDRYNALIASAAQQAEALGFNNDPKLREAYFQDLHEALKIAGSLFERVLIAEVYQNIFNAEGKLAKYEDFLLNFALHVQQAIEKSGSTEIEYIDSIIDTFISGLASAGKLSALPSLGKEQEAQAVMDHFNLEIERLLKGNNPITDAAVMAIHYRTIPYVVVKADINIAFLESLRKKIAELKALSQKIKERQACLEQKDLYTVEEISAFLGEKLPPKAAEFKPLAEYRAARQEMARIDREITDLKRKSKDTTQEERADLQKEIQRLEQAVLTCRSTIAGIEQEIKRLEKIASQPTKKHPVFHEVHIYTLPPKEDNDAKIESKRQELQRLQHHHYQLSTRLDQKTTKLEEMSADVGEEEISLQKQISSLTQQRKVFAQKEIALSGNDILWIAEDLLNPPVNARLGKAYAQAKKTSAEIPSLEDSRAQLEAQVKKDKSKCFNFGEQERGTLDEILKAIRKMAEAVDQSIRSGSVPDALRTQLAQLLDPVKYPDPTAVGLARKAHNDENPELLM